MTDTAPLANVHIIRRGPGLIQIPRLPGCCRPVFSPPADAWRYLYLELPTRPGWDPGPGGDLDLHLVVVVTTPGGPRDADEQVIGGELRQSIKH